jgi:DNA/RNA non-specific endonuclease
VDAYVDQVMAQQGLDSNDPANQNTNPCKLLNLEAGQPVFSAEEIPGSNVGALPGFEDATKEYKTTAMLVRIARDYGKNSGTLADPVAGAFVDTYGVRGAPFYDEAGHLFDRYFGGQGSLPNIVPMGRTTNRSEWASQRNTISSGLAGGWENVCVLVLPLYLDGGHPNRPSEFAYAYWSYNIVQPSGNWPSGAHLKRIPNR